MIADIEGRLAKFYEWNGLTFVDKSSSIGGFFADSLDLTGTIESIHLQRNYALIVERDGNKRYGHLLAKSQKTGDWTLLDMSKNCSFANTKKYGETIRDNDSDHCLEWNDKIFVETSPNLFVVGISGTDVINVFNFTGSNFTEISGHSDLFPDVGFQKSKDNEVYTTNFQQPLDNISLLGNTLAISFKYDGKERLIVFLFDGKKFQLMYDGSWSVSEKREKGVFYAIGNYALFVSYGKSNVILFRKEQSSAGIYLRLANDNLFPFSGEENNIYVSLTDDALYLEEKNRKDLEGSILQNGHYHRLLLRMPMNSSENPVDFTSSLAEDETSLSFSQNDPIVFLVQRHMGNGKLCDGSEICESRPYSAHRIYSGSSFFTGASFAELTLGLPSRWILGKRRFSSADRLLISSVLDLNTGLNLVGFGQYSGRNYTEPDSVPVVVSHWVENGLKNNIDLKTYYNYKGGSGIFAYNVHTQTIQFKNPVVEVKNSSGSLVSKTKYDFVRKVFELAEWSNCESC